MRAFNRQDYMGLSRARPSVCLHVCSVWDPNSKTQKAQKKTQN